MKKCICNDFSNYKKLNFWDENTQGQGIPLVWGKYSALYFGINSKNNKHILIAFGDDDAIWYPKYCPKCGREL